MKHIYIILAIVLLAGCFYDVSEPLSSSLLKRNTNVQGLNLKVVSETKFTMIDKATKDEFIKVEFVLEIWNTGKDNLTYNLIAATINDEEGNVISPVTPFMNTKRGLGEKSILPGETIIENLSFSILPELTIQDESLFIKGIRIETIDPCTKFTNIEDADMCYIRYSVLHEKADYCKKVSNNNSLNTCYLQLAYWYNEPEFCEGVEFRNDIEVCWFGLAAQTNDASYCQKLRNIEGLPYQQDVCVKVASVPNSKPNERNEELLNSTNIYIPTIITGEEQDAVIIEEFS